MCLDETKKRSLIYTDLTPRLIAGLGNKPETSLTLTQK